MTEAKDNSSLPLLLSISGIILTVAVGGWFYLEHEDSLPDASQNAGVAPLLANRVVPTDNALFETIQTVVESELQAEIETDAGPELDPTPAPATESGGKQNDTVSAHVDAELRKARLAANADVLVFPPGRSALDYYGSVLEADPQHAVAIAELDATLARVGQTVTRHLEAKEFDAAYEIAVLVARHRPENSLVVETQQTLDDYTEQLIVQAMQRVRDGEDDEGAQLIATAEALPGRNPEYFTAIRDSIAEIRNVRQAAERDKFERAQLANDEAKAAWVAVVRDAIGQGFLVSPVGASARDLLAEPNNWSAERSQLSSELQSALIDATKSHINAKRLYDAEILLNAAAKLGGESEGLEEIRGSLERALIDAESKRIAALSEFVQLKSVQPRYPRRAHQRNQAGWVEVIFTITPSGDTANIQVSRSDPKSVFELAATDAVEQWEFEPVQYRGQVISRRAAVRLVFRVE